MAQIHCIWCNEVLLPAETRHAYANGPQAHHACALRQVIGSVAHLERRCSCYVPGATEDETDETAYWNYPEQQWEDTP